MKYQRFLVALFIPVTLFFGCSGPDEKKAKFFEKGQTLFAQKDYVKAALEFKNAIQIDPKYAEAYLMLGKVGLAEKDPVNAYKYYLQAVELAPDCWEAHLGIARIMLGARQPDQAMEKADLVLAQQPENREALLLKGAVWVAKKEFGQAVSQLEALMKKGGTSPDAVLLLATAYLNQGELSAAEETLGKGAVANPESVAIRVALAERARLRNRIGSSLEWINEARRIEPGNEQLIFLLARVNWEDGRLDEAGKILDNFTADPKGEGDARYLGTAQFCLAMKDADRAEKYLRKGLERHPDSLKLRLALADLAANSGNRREEAVALLRECVALGEKRGAPEAVQAHNGLARIFLGRNDPAGAEEQVSAVLKDNPANVDAHFIKGRILLGRRQGSEAVAEFRAVIQEDPKSVPARLGLSEAHLLNGEVNLARDVLEKGVKDLPEAEELKLALARFYARSGNRSGAEGLYRALLEKKPEADGVRAELGDLLAAGGEDARAEEIYRGLIEELPRSPLGYMKLAVFYQERGKLPQSVAVLEQGTASVPDSDLLAGSLLRSYLQQKKTGKAEQWARERLRLNPAGAFNHNLLGEALLAKKDRGCAEASFRQAIEAAPKWPLPWRNLVGSRLAAKDIDGAIAGLRGALAANPDNIEFSRLLGQILVRENRHGEAVRVYREVLDRHPDSGEVANDLAYLLVMQAARNEEFAEAQIWAEKANNLRPGDPAVMDTLGWLHFRKGEFQRAADLLQKAQEKAGQVAVINFHLGMALHRLGQNDRARVFLEKSLTAADGFEGRKEAEEVLGRM
ncbi:MAG: tetratricopeptide repeat protein [Deltaproteobacteria bacterium]|nr:tetratricopeptide repeat protein [Deltaproteobacteria bacterium]